MRIRSLILAAALVLGGAVVASPAQAANIATNPGFESGLTGWTCSSGAQAVTSPVRSGASALAATPAGSAFARCSQTVTVQPNTAYTLSAWVRGPYVFLGAIGFSETWAAPGAN